MHEIISKFGNMTSYLYMEAEIVGYVAGILYKPYEPKYTLFPLKYGYKFGKEEAMI